MRRHAELRVDSFRHLEAMIVRPYNLLGMVKLLGSELQCCDDRTATSEFSVNTETPVDTESVSANQVTN